MEQEYTILDTSLSLGEFQKALRTVEFIGFDIETSGLNFLSDRIRLAQFELGSKVFILDFDNYPDAQKNFKYVVSLIKDTNKTIISHNVKFELKFTLKSTGILLTKVFCTQLAQSIHLAGIARGKDKFPKLSTLVDEYCGVTLDKEIRLNFVTSPEITQEMYDYAVLDVKYLKEIMMLQKLEAVERGYPQVFDLEMELIPVVAQMEYDGVLVNWDVWYELALEAEKVVEEAKETITKIVFESTWDKAKEEITDGISAYEYYEIPIPKTQNSKKFRVDRTFLETLTSPEFILEELKTTWNVGSNAQKLRALQLCGVSVSNTKRSTLERITTHNILVTAMLDFNRANKIATTYGRNWEELIHPDTGRVHPTYNQMGAATGRWSSDNPNMQNIPKQERYRNCFLAREGYKILTCDFSQAEMRIMGAVSREQRIIEAYVKGEDIHAKTASGIYDLSLEEVTHDQRDKGKTVNFSIIYGTTAYGMSVKNEGLSEEEAEELLSKFFESHPSLDYFIQRAGNLVVEHLKSRTPFGRVRYFENKTTFKDYKQRKKWIARLKREGVNHIIQGCSADSLKIAMVSMFYNNPFGHENFRFLIQVHDEVVVEVREDITEEATKFLVSHMEQAEQQFLGEIPAVADCLPPLDYWSKGE